MLDATQITLDPLLPLPWLIALGAVMLVFLAVAVWSLPRGAAWRGLAMVVVWLALAQPSLVQEQRTPVRDVAVIVDDRSASMQIGARRDQADQAITALRARLGELPGLEVRVVEAGAREGGVDETHLFGALDEAIADVPRRRLAGVVVVSDGQVHDVPRVTEGVDPGYGPVHLLAAGEKDEVDRRVRLVRAPSFGLVGQEVVATFRVDDLPEGAGEPAVTATVEIDGSAQRVLPVPIGREVEVTLPVEHGGQNLFEIVVPELEGEQALANNRLAIVVNGVRDRLRVLLVSGEPHNGERTWRNLLKSDPSVDLVHFTILRPPTANDDAREDELSLIAFPTEELFAEKLKEFDLIIFDRYRRNRILDHRYFANMAEYVREGGAMLISGGDESASGASIYATPLVDVLPAIPVGNDSVQQAFRPRLNEMGLRHPVTMALDGANASLEAEPGWGRWLAQVALEPFSATSQVIMSGAAGLPLLILERVGEGRVAQLGSDHIWLWDRGFEGGGPQAELLRRLAHWLMKEPELEESDLRARVDGNRITVTRRDIERRPADITMTTPLGEASFLPMTEAPPGVWTHTVGADQPGIYRFSDGDRQAIAIVGRVNPPEFTDTRTTTEQFRALAEASGGGLLFLADGLPAVRRVQPDRSAAGDDWIGLRQTGDYVVDRVRDAPLMPAWAALVLVLVTTILGWWRESR